MGDLASQLWDRKCGHKSDRMMGKWCNPTERRLDPTFEMSSDNLSLLCIEACNILQLGDQLLLWREYMIILHRKQNCSSHFKTLTGASWLCESSCLPPPFGITLSSWERPKIDQGLCALRTARDLLSEQQLTPNVSSCPAVLQSNLSEGSIYAHNNQ